jgi:hypothetical protein
MEKVSFPKSVFVTLAGPIYGLLYFTVRLNFLGFRLSSWLKFLPLALMVVAWLAGWSMALVLVGLLLAIVTQIAYWQARRQGYLRFIPFSQQQVPATAEPIADYDRIEALATGTFSVNDRQAYVLQQPAQYWRVPVGDHAVMVQREPGSFLYQFVQAGSLEKVEDGMLVFGTRPHEALALTFLTSWVPENNEPNFNQFRTVENDIPKVYRHTIYLIFQDKTICHRVWANLLRDTRPVVGDAT